MKRIINRILKSVLDRKPKTGEEWFYVFSLSFIAILVTALAWYMVPHGKQCYGGHPFYLNCDFSLWYQASLKFPVAFKYGNILIHRPLFAAIGGLFYYLAKVAAYFLNFHPSELKLFVYTWRMQNIIFYLGLIVLAFECGRVTWNKRVGFYLALLIAVSSHSYAWLMQPLNNIQGFFPVLPLYYHSDNH